MNYVALCARPQSGKTTVKNLLLRQHPFADLQGGLVVRRLAAAITGIPIESWISQDQKLEAIDFNGKTFSKREFLGLAGKGFEEQFGDGSIPSSAIMLAGEPNGRILVDDSTRRGQGWVFKRAGGLVIEIVKPGVEKTGFDFDEYDPAAVDMIVFNDGDMADLALFVEHYLAPLLLSELRGIGFFNPFEISVRGYVDDHRLRAA